MKLQKNFLNRFLKDFKLSWKHQCDCVYLLYRKFNKINLNCRVSQRCREGTSSVAFEVLIMNCKIHFINFFNYLASNINFIIFNCLASSSDLCFPKPIFLKQKRTAFYGCTSIVSDFKLTQKMVTCYL